MESRLAVRDERKTYEKILTEGRGRLDECSRTIIIIKIAQSLSVEFNCGMIIHSYNTSVAKIDVLL